MLIVILGAALGAVLFYYLFVKPHNYWKDRGVKQGKPWWLFGDFGKNLFRQQSIAELMQYAYNQIPSRRYFGLYQFTKPVLIVKDVDLIKQITVKDFDHFTDHRSIIPENADPLWNKNLFALKDEEIVTLEMKGLFTRFTNDAIATTAFGVKVDSLAEPNNEFYLMGKKVTTFSFWRTLRFAGYSLFPKLYQIIKVKFFDNKVGNFFRQVINDTIKIRLERAIVRPDMIHLLMQARKGIEKHEKNGVIDTGFATAQESDLGTS
ncbi:hypothetical protein NQ314_019097 [Rhamnusium bicolor]|uniref:Cytochrome P450 n=1 Tax=Rhamnusium bicolor TaxID=1586634 RepID=A0AAV8WPI1_9CUCU|nr:hypothetical protein NQ314_019097 [Rhamnusium bicolor]